MQPFPLSAVAFDGGIVTEAGHGMAPFFVFDTLPLCVLAVTEFEFLLDTS
jgi:hypothetical protein